MSWFHNIINKQKEINNEYTQEILPKENNPVELANSSMVMWQA